MELVDQKYEILRWDPKTDVRMIATAAALCYGNEPPIGYHEQQEYIGRVLRKDPKHPHMTPLEQSILTVKFTTNRAITHEIIRHRPCSMNERSTRYCNFSKTKFGNGVPFIRNNAVIKVIGLDAFIEDCEKCEQSYFDRLNNGCNVDQARGALNNDVAAMMIETTNYREWRHILSLRTDRHAHPQMVELMTPLLETLKEELPTIFGDINND